MPHTATPSTDEPSHDLQRPRGGVVGWMTRHPVILAVMGLLLVLAMGVFAFGRNAENRYQRMLREIRARGEPTTVEELIAATPGLPEEENALLRVLQYQSDISALKMSKEQDELLPWVGLALTGITGTQMRPEQSAAASQYLAYIQAPLGKMEDAIASGPGLHRRPLSTPMFNTLWPELSRIRAAMKVLTLATVEAAQRKDAGRTETLITRQIEFCEMLDGKRALIEGLVKLASVEMTHEAIERSINLDVLPAESLKRISMHLQKIQLRNLLRDGYIAERVMLIDTLEWIRNNPGSASTLLGRTGPTAPPGSIPGAQNIPGLRALNGAECLKLYEELIAAAAAPGGDAIRRSKAISNRTDSLPWYQMVTKAMMPSLSWSATLWMRSIGKQRALQVALACEGFRLKHGAWPDGLDALVPEFLDAVPLDPFDEKPIRFARIQEGIQIWCVDHDFVDNGGDIHRMSYRYKKGATDIGWVILDPPLRNRPAEPDTTTRPAGP